MADINKADWNFDSTSLLYYIFQKRKPLLIIILIAALLSAFFSSPDFIEPLYKSRVILFPTSTNSISKALINDDFGNSQDIMEFGDEEQTEQLLQILNSNQIRNRIIEKYDLLNHYKIDTTGTFTLTRLYSRFESRISFRRTEYQAIEIQVLDTDPVVSCNIANSIAEILDSIKISMQKARALQGFRIVESEYLKLSGEIRQMEDSLTKLRLLGIHDYESQSEMINQQLAIELAKGNTKGVSALEEKLRLMAKYGGAYVSLRDALEHEKKKLSYVKARYNEAKIDAEKELPQKFVVSKAIPAEKKSYPIRWLIVSISVFLAFFAGVSALIILDRLKPAGRYRRHFREK